MMLYEKVRGRLDDFTTQSKWLQKRGKRQYGARFFATAKYSQPQPHVLSFEQLGVQVCGILASHYVSSTMFPRRELCLLAEVGALLRMLV